MVAVVDLLDAGALAQPGVVQAGAQRPVLPPEPLALDQQRQPVLEPQLPGAALAALLLQRLDHAKEFHRVELAHGLFVQHGAFLFLPSSAIWRIQW